MALTVYFPALSAGSGASACDLALHDQNGRAYATLAEAGPQAEKEFRRRVSALRAYLMLAADRSESARLLACARPRPDFDGTAVWEGEAALLSEYGTLPESVGPDAPSVAWFARFLEAGENGARALALYNAFGTLPGGFPRIRETLLARLTPAQTDAFLATAAALKAEPDNLTERGLPVPRTDFGPVDFGALKAAWLHCHAEWQ